LKGTKLISALECLHAEYFSINVKIYGYYLFTFWVSNPLYLLSRVEQLPSRTLESLFQKNRDGYKRINGVTKNINERGRRKERIRNEVGKEI
jgi:hypothetical protein